MDKITIGIDGDTSALEGKLSELQKKINSFRTGGAMESLGKVSGAGKDVNERMRQSKAEIFKRTQNQIDGELNKQLGKYSKITSEIDSQVSKSEALNRSTKEYAETLERISKLRSEEGNALTNISRLESQRKQMGSMGALDGKAPDAYGEMPKKGFGKMMDAFGGGSDGGGGAFGKMINRFGPGAIGAGIAATGAAINTGGKFVKQIMTYPERQAKREATTAGMLGETARLQSQRKSYEMNLYGPERMKAIERAGTRVTAEKVEDTTGLIGSVLAGAGAGAVTGSVLGAKTGALAMNPLTALGGGLVGGIGGAIAGGATAFGGNMFNDRKRSMVTDAVGLTEGNYEKEMDAVFSDTYKEQFEVEKAKSYEKNLASSFLEKNSERFTDLQRGMGLSDEDLFEGKESIFQRAGRAGYGMDDITQNMQGIMAGGGRASIAAEGGQVTAQMQRNLDLTNAPELLGKVSGASGEGVGESKDALIRMYAEATRIGLDASEVRGFLQTSADMASKSGASTDIVSQLLSAGMGDLKSGRGIQASTNALENIKNKTSEMGGLTGQYQLAEMSSQEITDALGGKELTLKEQAYLGGTDVTKIEADDEYVKGLFMERGEEWTEEKGKELVGQLRKGKTKASFKSDDQEKTSIALEEAQTKLDEFEGTGNVIEDEVERSKLEDNVLLAKKRAKDAMSLAEGDFAKMGKPEQDAQLRLQGKLLKDDFTSADTKGVEEQLQTDSDRLVDEKKRSNAQADDIGNLERLTKMTPKLTEAFKNTTTQTVNLGKAFDDLQKKLDKVKSAEEKESLREVFKEILEKITNQGSGGSEQDMSTNPTKGSNDIMGPFSWE